MEQMTPTKLAADAPRPYVVVEQQRLDLTVDHSAPLNLSFAPCVWDSELFLVIDLYSAAHQVHPEGHVGWWKWPLENKGDLKVEVIKAPEGFTVTFDGEATQEFWQNPDFLGVEEPVIALHVVLRPVISEAVRFDDVLYLYNSVPSLEHDQHRRDLMERPNSAALSTPWYVWPRQSMVHLIATNVFERDAVGNFVLSLYGLLRANGIGAQIYATNFDPALRETIRHTCELFTSVGEDDLVFVNFSIFDPWLSDVAASNGKKVFYFHNITPPRFLQIYDAEYAGHCADAIAQLKHLKAFDALLANSASSARVLQDFAARLQPKKALADLQYAPSHGPFEEATRLLEKAMVALDSAATEPLKITTTPPTLGIRDWNEVGSEPVELPPEGTLLLYVGRVAPHKKIEDLVAMFDRYRMLNPDSALLIVGSVAFDGYIGFLRYLLNNEFAHLKDHVHFRGVVSDGQLKTLYERCAAFVTMSEHEGFCVPIVEAMAFGKPVFAYAEEAVLETLGRSGRAFYYKDFEAVAADLDSVLSTPWIGQMLVAEQERRLEEIKEQAAGGNLWSVLEKVVYGARTF